MRWARSVIEANDVRQNIDALSVAVVLNQEIASRGSLLAGQVPGAFGQKIFQSGYLRGSY